MNTFPSLDSKFIEPKKPSLEYLRKTFKTVDKLINKLHKFLTEIGVDYNDIEKIRISKNEKYIIITTSNSVANLILHHVDDTTLNLSKHDDGVSVTIE